jgi:hypothetical protein
VGDTIFSTIDAPFAQNEISTTRMHNCIICSASFEAATVSLRSPELTAFVSALRSVAATGHPDSAGRNCEDDGCSCRCNSESVHQEARQVECCSQDAVLDEATEYVAGFVLKRAFSKMEAVFVAQLPSFIQYY